MSGIEQPEIIDKVLVQSYLDQQAGILKLVLPYYEQDEPSCDDEGLKIIVTDWMDSLAELGTSYPRLYMGIFIMSGCMWPPEIEEFYSFHCRTVPPVQDFADDFKLIAGEFDAAANLDLSRPRAVDDVAAAVDADLPLIFAPYQMASVAAPKSTDCQERPVSREADTGTKATPPTLQR